MAGSTPIREYLVSLGFKISEGGLSKFNQSIDLASRGALGLGAAVTSAATAVEVAVMRIAREYENLYYVSQRTGASVSNLQAWSFAGKQVGATADSMRSAIEGVARSMRSSPGVGALLNQLGIKTQGRDTTQVLVDFVGQMRKLPFYIASQYGSLVGIDPDTLLQLENNYDRLVAAQEAYLQRQKEAGVNAEELASKSTDYGRAVNQLGSDIQLFGDRLVQHFIGPATDTIKVIDEVVRAINRFNADNETAINVETGIAGFFGFLIARAVLLRTTLLLLGETAASVVGTLTGGGLIAAIGRGLAAMGAAGTGLLAGALLMLSTRPAGAGEDELQAQREAAAKAGGGSGPLSYRNNNPGNLRSWAGTSSSGGFAKFPTAVSGFSAMAGQLLRYGDRGINTLHDIISRWAPPSENDTAGYIDKVSKATGYDPNATLNLRDPTVLQRVMDAMAKHEAGGNPWGDNLASLEQAAVLGRLGGAPLMPAEAAGAGVSISSKTDIHVDGAGDPVAVAGRVAAAQDEVNSTLTRNVIGAIR